jgi:cytochrome b involved in lipid metabolism
MKKIVVGLIVLFVIVSLSGVIYFFTGLSNENAQNNIEVKDINLDSQNQNNVSQTTSSPIIQDVSKNIQSENLYPFSEVQKRNSKESCWSVIRDNVYDLTSWIANHPGGEKAILNICGKDGTEVFVKQHSGKEKPENILKQFKIGVLLK